MRTQILRRFIYFYMLGVCFMPVAAMAADELYHGPNMDSPSDGRGNRTRHMPSRGHAPTAGSVAQGNGINYHNGPVMRSGVNIYYIWYGNWAQDATANAILTDYAINVGGSPYFNINTTYGDTVGNVPNTPSTIKYVTSTSDTGSLGTSLTNGNIWTLVTNALSGAKLPIDPNGVYFVLTAPHVGETSGFLTQYCGWHTYNYYGNSSIPIKYAFVGNPAAAMGACAAQSTGPNGDAQADAMVSVIAHELQEAATDPQLSAWYDSNGQENSDKCAWTFGAVYSSNGASANMKIGMRNYLIQQNWVNSGGGSCALSYAPAASGFSLSASPATQTVFPGQTTGAYAVTATPIGGWSGAVTYTVTAGLPSGALAHVSGNSITVSTTAATAPGTYNLTITGTSGALIHTTAATLVISAPTFSLSMTPASLAIVRPSTGSATATYAVSLAANAGYSGLVNLTTTGAATGVSLTLSSTSVLNASKAITLNVVVTPSARKGASTLTVTAKDSVTTKSATALLTIN